MSLALMGLAALVLRLYAARYYPVTSILDAADYDRLAKSLVESHSYVQDGILTAWRAPGYPMFLAVVYSLCGMNTSSAIRVQVFLGVADVLLLALLSARIFGRELGFITGVLAAVYPVFFWLPRILLSENLSLVFLLAALLSSAQFLDSGRIRSIVLTAFLLGVSILIRPVNVLTALLLMIGFLVIPAGRVMSFCTRILAILILLAGTFAVQVPWMIRNYRLFGRYAPLATQEGITFYSSYWPPEIGGKKIWGNLAGIDDPFVAMAYRTGDEAAVSEKLKSETWRRLRKEPAIFFQALPAKLIYMLAPFDWELFPRSHDSQRAFNLAYVLLCAPALYGFCLLRHSLSPNKWLLWVAPWAVLIQAIVFYGSPRFRLPAETSFLVLAAAGLRGFNGAIVRWRRNWSGGPRKATVR